MQQRFDFGTEVRVLRNVRDDGTFPGARRGDLLVRRGSTGFVRDVGTFLQDQIIYTVHFLAEDRLVGCRDHELQPATAPWRASAFEVREKVLAARPLGIAGKVVAAPGSEGEIVRVLRDEPGGVSYHVRFASRTLHVPECALTLADGPS
ncbi:MAG: nitrogen fixation protein NifZ [Roseicyclus sp.]